MTEVVSTDPRRESLVVDQRGDGLAKAVRGDFGNAKLLTCCAPLLAEVVGIAKRAGLIESLALLADEPVRHFIQAFQTAMDQAHDLYADQLRWNPFAKMQALYLKERIDAKATSTAPSCDATGDARILTAVVPCDPVAVVSSWTPSGLVLKRGAPLGFRNERLRSVREHPR